MVETIKSRPRVENDRGCRPKTHRLYLPAAEYKASAGRSRPALVPGTFKLLVFSS